MAAAVLLLTINTLRWRALDAAEGPPLPNITATTPLPGDTALFDPLEWLHPDLPSLSRLEALPDPERI
jgi:hypothetical protein